MRLRYLLFCIPAFLTGNVSAQDTHYWTQQFGPKTILLSGADALVTKDDGAGINNPGGLGFIDNPNLSISTNAYGISNSKFKDGAGKGLDLKSTQMNMVPVIISGSFKHKKLKKWTVGYTLADKARYNFQATQRYDGVQNVLNDSYSNGQEEFVSQTDISNSLSEIWAGFTVAYRLNKHWAIGVSNFGAYRQQNFSEGYIARAIVNDTSGIKTVTSNLLYGVSYYSIRNIFKLGVSGSFRNTDVGLSVTMPSFTMYSDATVNSDLTGSNISLSGSLRGDIVANDRQDGLKAKYRSPFSISAGVAHRFGKTKFYLSTEFFNGIKPYIYIFNPISMNSFARKHCQLKGAISCYKFQGVRNLY